MLLIANAVQNAMVGPDTLLTGGVLADHLRREGLDQDTLEAALWEHGVANVTDVEMAVLEIDGSISIVPARVETRHVRRPRKYLKHP